jgi:hypothetical protein
MRFKQRMLFLALLLLLGLSAPYALRAAQPAAPSFISIRPVVAPVQPVAVSVSVPQFTGPAVLVVYDSANRAVGSWEFTISGGYAVVHVLPRGMPGQHRAVLFANGTEVARGPLYALKVETTIQTGDPKIDQLFAYTRDFIEASRLGYELNGEYIHGYRSPDSALLWLRDHYYQGRGFRYFETDVTSLLDAVRNVQNPDGSLPDFIARPDLNVPTWRTPVEADVEYLFVQAVYEAWQMTGDDVWMSVNIPAMQAALNYTLNDPLRWEPNLGLVKRPYTIDTWDFEYGATTTHPQTGEPAPRHWIDEQTRWGIFHGDNTGLAQALYALAHMEEHLGQSENAQYHRDVAGVIMWRLNELSWNGNFYLHHFPLQPWDVPGVQEERQLSLSNAIALNRGVLNPTQGRAIINEYRRRLKDPGNTSFAEWWSIHPAFPEGSFGLAGRLGESPGEYVNGGIMPLVGGELSRGAFRFGYEAYGFDILRRYYDLVSRTGASYLWYYPTGGFGIGSLDTLPTDGWGASAMLAALMEGAAGVEDHGVGFSQVMLSPRWPAARTLLPGAPGNDSGPGTTTTIQNITSAYVVAHYPASNNYVAYQWEIQPTKQSSRVLLKLQATGTGAAMHLRLMLPPETQSVEELILNGQPVPATVEHVMGSAYMVLDVPGDIVQVQAELKID